MKMAIKSKSMEFTRYLLHIGGLIPNKKSHQRQSGFLLYSFCGKVGTPLVFFMAIAYLAIKNDLKNSIMSILITIATTHIVVKQYLLGRNKSFVKMLELAQQLLEEIVFDNESKKIFDAADNLCLKASKLLYYGIFVYPFVNVFLELTQYYVFNREPEPMLQLWSPFRSYYAQMAFKSIIVYSIILTESAFLTSLLTVTTHVSSCIKILALRLKHESSNSPEADRKNLELHCDLIKLVYLTNASYGAMLTLEIFLSSLQGCFAAYQMLGASKNFNFFMSIFTFIIISQLPFIICTSGQRIESEGDKMFRLVYQSPWYERSPKSRKTIVFILLMMSKPLKLHYKKFIFFNMERFAAVIQASYSFIAMVRVAFF